MLQDAMGPHRDTRVGSDEDAVCRHRPRLLYDVGVAIGRRDVLHLKSDVIPTRCPHDHFGIQVQRLAMSPSLAECSPKSTGTQILVASEAGDGPTWSRGRKEVTDEVHYSEVMVNAVQARRPNRRHLEPPHHGTGHPPCPEPRGPEGRLLDEALVDELLQLGACPSSARSVHPGAERRAGHR